MAVVGASLFALASAAELVLTLTAEDAQPGRQILLRVIVTGLLLAITGGLWRSRYWAVLGMQAVLAVQIISGSLFLILVGGLNLGTLYSVIVVAPSATLFWFLVKAMARLQMPDRPLMVDSHEESR